MSNDIKHTPEAIQAGKVEIDDSNQYFVFTIYCPESFSIEEAYKLKEKCLAAPDMLEALTFIYNSLQWHKENSTLKLNEREIKIQEICLTAIAIAKAEGKQ